MLVSAKILRVQCLLYTLISVIVFWTPESLLPFLPALGKTMVFNLPCSKIDQRIALGVLYNAMRMERLCFQAGVFFLLLLIFTGVYLFYSVVLVSLVQKNKSVMYMCVCIYIYIYIYTYIHIYMYIYILSLLDSFLFRSHSSLSKVPCAIQDVFIKKKNLFCCCSVTKLCLTLCNPVDCITPGSPVLHCHLEFAQTHVH